MKKAIITFFLCILSGFCIETGAQTQNIESCFVSAPDSLLPHLSINDRKDLLDLYKAGQESRVKGRLGTHISLENIGETALTLSLSEAATLQIALLPVKSETVIAVIHTVKLPVADSRINFYDSRWNPLDNQSFFTPPTAADFLTGNKKPKADAASRITLLPVEYTIDGKNLIATQHLQDYLPEEIYKDIETMLFAAPLTYKWNGKRFAR